MTRYKKYLQMNVKMVFNSQKRAEKEVAKRKRGEKKLQLKENCIEAKGRKEMKIMGDRSLSADAATHRERERARIRK